MGDEAQLDPSEAAPARPAALVNFAAVDAGAAIDADTLNRFLEGGWRFTAKVLMRAAPAAEVGTLADDTEG